MVSPTGSTGAAHTAAAPSPGGSEASRLAGPANGSSSSSSLSSCVITDGGKSVGPESASEAAPPPFRAIRTRACGSGWWPLGVEV